MTINTFERHIKAKRQQLHIAKLSDEKTSNYLLDVSIDYNGSNLSLLLSKDETKFAKEFISLMAKNKFSSAKTLRLLIKKPKEVLNKIDLYHDKLRFRGSKRLADKIKWASLWHGQGYPIGIITKRSVIHPDTSKSSQVYLCTDLTLRCRRNSPLFEDGQSYASGIGSVPEKYLQKFTFRIGNFTGNYQGIETDFKDKKLKDLLILFSENALLD